MAVDMLPLVRRLFVNAKRASQMLNKLKPCLALLGAACVIAGCTSEASDETTTEETAPVTTPDPVPAEIDDAAITAIREFIATLNLDTAQPGWKTALRRPPQQTFDSGTSYYWNLQTSEGPIKIKLLADVAPMHVTSTIYLTELGFYDDVMFHRVIPGFMAQGGDPLGTGRGGPGYKYAGEFSASVKHDRPGLLSMANAGPNTDGSQFFLTFVPTPHLDGKHTIFGEVITGMETVRKLEAQGSPGRGTPKKDLIIQKATITTG